MMNKFCCYFLIVVLIASLILLANYLNLKQKLILEVSKDKNLIQDTYPTQSGSMTESSATNAKLETLIKKFIDTPKDYHNVKRDSLDKTRFIPDILPLKAELAISQDFSESHPGIDLVAPHGTEVIASAAGKVQFSGFDEYFGNLVILDHFNGYYTYYAHLFELRKKPGDFAEKKEIIGKLGTTGFSTGPHLHYSIEFNGDFIDPGEFLD
jgi:murein DD-endopeptidase MepM/ murein hydrolase activator NlpD